MQIKGDLTSLHYLKFCSFFSEKRKHQPELFYMYIYIHIFKEQEEKWKKKNENREREL